ncbi:MAG: ComF family protein [Cyclobacteriaceae bacterium]
MLSDFLSLIYPATCLNCNQTLISAENFICTSCKVDFPLTNDHVNPENELYQKFAAEPLVRSASSYLYFNEGGIAQKLIHALKYEGASQVGNMLGSLYGKSISQDFKPEIIAPVPIHKKRLKKRGYNQSLGIAVGLAEHFDGAEVRDDLVFRVKNTETQTKRNKVSRWLNVENIYSNIEEDLTGKEVLVVDDVITTGATVGMLCSKLREANVASIHIVCAARG